MRPLLPLFPLDLVLLPGAPLPLHIFEPRYREMIAECVTENTPFGVVRVEQEEKQIADIGCTAEIISVGKQYDDGRMDILTRGAQRFEVVRIARLRAFLQAEVTYLHDVEDAPGPDAITKVVALQAEILSLADAQVDSSGTIEDGMLSFHLASSLPVDLDFKQHLLSMNSEAERIQSLISFFESILPNLRRAIRVRKKASSNGHAL
jgi:Lon protease-like protein